jgi:glutaminyl-peptide cyclotransferase
LPERTGKKRSSSKQAWWLIVLLSVLLALGVILALQLTKPREVHSSLPEQLDQTMTYEVVQAYPHDPAAFTQGLIYLDGFLYESTGLYGQSSLRKVDLETGEIFQQVDIPEGYFAEGLTEWDDTLVQLTWQEHTGFVYSLSDFQFLREFTYATEGWGLTHNEEQLVMSDGSSTIFFLDPETFEVQNTINVNDQGQEIRAINELEWVKGEIFANIWQTDDIIRIDPLTGNVLGWIDLRGLLPDEERTQQTNVLNGIAYDAATDRLFVTGKLWPKLYEIKLVPVE